MGKVVVLNGKEFRLKGKIFSHDIYESRRTIYDCYDKPSQAKVAIWESWVDWALYIDTEAMLWVNSFNYNMFTISGIIGTEIGVCYLYITKTRQELWLVQY